MAAKKSKQYPYQWANGSWHSTPDPSHPPGPAKGSIQPAPLPPPPVGTYDPAIDYNAGASQTGYENTADDAATSYEQGQEDYGIGLGNLTTQLSRTKQDLDTQAGNVERQYGILGDQQVQAARQHGIESPGLLALSASKRAANQQHDLEPIKTAFDRANQDFTTNKNALNLANARQFGGYGGHELLDPITGQPVFGSLLTGLTRAGTENNAFQTGSAQQRAFGAAASGYVPPSAPVVHPALAPFLKKRRPPAPAKGLLR